MRRIRSLTGVIGLLTIVWGFPVVAQPSELTRAELEEEVEVSYIYAAVLGTGTYKVNGRRVSMFRLPISWTQRAPAATSAGWRWHLPVAVGYDDLGSLGSDWIEALLPDQLVTLTVLPGFEYIKPLSPRWQIKPFLHMGGGRDFSAGETVLMTQFGVRSLALFRLREKWALRWGNTLSWAGEYQLHSEDHSGFGIFESGLDLRRDLPFELNGRSLDVGTYYVYQRFMPKWSTSRTPDQDQKAILLHEVGLSFGLKQPFKLLGIELQRVRFGIKRGDGVRGWTIGTEFPF